MAKFQVLVFTNNERNLPECSEEFCVCNVPDKRKGTFRGIKEAARFAAVAGLIHCLEARSASSEETGCKVSIAKVGLGGIPMRKRDFALELDWIADAILADGNLDKVKSRIAGGLFND